MAEPVTIIRPGTKLDGYGATVDDWDTAQRLPLSGGALVAPRSSSDLDPTRPAGIVEGLAVYLRPEHPVPTSRDRLEVRGKPHQLQGTPAVWTDSATGARRGTIVNVERVGG